MVGKYLAVGMAIFAWAPSAPAFQPSTDTPNITPRAKPRQANTGAPAPLVRVDSSLVLISAHVTNAIGGTVTDLTREHFHLFENNIEQNITYFAREDAPISIGVLFDKSASMKNKSLAAAQSLDAFFRTANLQDEFFLVEFNRRPRVTVPFTRETGRITDQILRTPPGGMTCLLDAMRLALLEMKHAQYNRKALVIVSDGGDNWSRHNLREIKGSLAEADLQVYAIGLFDSDYSRKSATEERNGPQLLDDLAGNTGGRAFAVRDLTELPAVSARISEQLRNQYLLGYLAPGEGHDGKYHQVQLKIAAPEDLRFHVDYRRGYYAPDR